MCHNAHSQPQRGDLLLNTLQKDFESNGFEWGGQKARRGKVVEVSTLQEGQRVARTDNPVTHTAFSPGLERFPAPLNGGLNEKLQTQTDSIQLRSLNSKGVLWSDKHILLVVNQTGVLCCNSVVLTSLFLKSASKLKSCLRSSQTAHFVPVHICA